MTHLMIDFETLGGPPLPALLSLGAVKFANGRIIDRFYQRICPQSCTDWGMHIDASTVLWWLEQSEAARREMSTPAMRVGDVLKQFLDWVSFSPVTKVWANGPTFDIAILEAVLKRCKLGKPPWKFSAERCFRTACDMRADRAYTKPVGAHHALMDAEAQATHLMALGIGNSFPATDTPMTTK